jgi:putative hemolysin
MQNTEFLLLIGFGLLIAAIGGFGNHLLTHFRGRTLEAYCRLKGTPSRFWMILDEQKDSQTACNYLFIMGISLALMAAGVLLALQFPSYETTSASAITLSITLSVAQLVSFSVIAATIVVSLYSWIPKIVVRNGAAVLLCHTWPLWRAIRWITRPFRALEYLFVMVGWRLSDRKFEDRQIEESLEDEVRKMMMTGERSGLVTKSMREMVTGVMNLDEGQVSQIMTPRSKVDAIDIDWQWPEVVAAVAQSGRTRMPVFEGSLDNIVGILFVKDLLAIFERPSPPKDASELKSLLRETWMIPETRKVDELIKDFLLRRTHMAIVVDEFQQTLGVVTIEDALEEIVGEIADELDVDEVLPAMIEDSDGAFSLAGALEISAINRQLSLDLPESDDYDTVAGLVISKLGTIPKVGSKARVGKYQFVVTQASPRQVQRLRVSISNAAPKTLRKG